MMDPVLYSGESPPPWPIESTRDPLNGMPARAENITSERRRELLRLDVLFLNELGLDVSEADFETQDETERDVAASDTIQDEKDLDHSYTMIVKATYKDDTVKFPFGSNSGIEELRRELDESFELKAERFKIKYEDEGDWILLSCDKHLRFRMDDLKSSGQTTMHVSIFPGANFSTCRL